MFCFWKDYITCFKMAIDKKQPNLGKSIIALPNEFYLELKQNGLICWLSD